MPANLAPPLDLTGIAARLAESLRVAVRQNRHGVWNSLGRKIGSYETLADLCQGRWIPFVGEGGTPYAELRVLDFGGRPVAASKLCLDRGQATTIATPKEVAAKAAEMQARSRAIIPGTTIALPQLPAAPTLGQLSYGQIALWGGAGLIAIALLRRRA